MADLLEGDPAPDFDLEADGGRRVRRADLGGKVVVLYFYPKDDTPGCTKQAIGFAERKAEFEAAGATVIGVSKDTPASHARFKSKHGFDLDLATADDAALAPWGAWVEKSMYGRSYMGIDRSTFLIDREGRIRRIWRKVKVPGHIDEVLTSVKSLA